MKDIGNLKCDNCPRRQECYNIFKRQEKELERIRNEKLKQLRCNLGPGICETCG